MLQALTVVGIQKDCPDCEGLPLSLEPCYICYGFGWYLEPFFPQQGGVYGAVGTHEQVVVGNGDGSLEDGRDVGQEDWGSLVSHSLLDYQDCIQQRNGGSE